MHYKNGRVAHNGDKVVFLPSYDVSPVIGILYDAHAGNDYCNGRIAPIHPSDPQPCLKDCLHLEDVKSALEIPVPPVVAPQNKPESDEQNSNSKVKLMYISLPAFIGTKIIGGEPMTQKEFFEKFKHPPLDITPQNIDGYHVQYENPDGSAYDSWSPKAVFEEAYTSTSENLTFDQAFFLMKKGFRLTCDIYSDNFWMTYNGYKFVCNPAYTDFSGPDINDICNTTWRVVTGD